MGITNDPEKLREAIKGRRARLRLTARDAAALGSVPPGTWSSLEQGRSPNPTPMTLGGVDEAMRWPYGTAAAVLRGECAPIDAVNLPVRPEQRFLRRPKRGTAGASNGPVG